MRCAVDYEVPGTMIGDGGPLRGTVFVDAPSPLAAFDRFDYDLIRHPLPPSNAVWVRAYPAEDVVEVHAAARARGEWA